MGNVVSAPQVRKDWWDIVSVGKGAGGGGKVGGDNFTKPT